MDDEDEFEVPETKPPEHISREVYLEWRSPRRGESQADDATNPVWHWLQDGGESDDEDEDAQRMSAWEANELFDGPDSCDVGPGWCASRFGQSKTELADGRIVLIAGEHEDHYDPDFFIYNENLRSKLAQIEGVHYAGGRLSSP